MSDHHIAVVGALPRSGLTTEEQRGLLLQLVQGPDSRVDRFPGAPNDYSARAKDLLFSVFASSVWAIEYFATSGALRGYSAGQGVGFGFAGTLP